MIVCGKCGEHNEDDAVFCSSCGEFLEWEGKRIEEQPAVVAAAEPQQAGVTESVQVEDAPPGGASEPKPEPVRAEPIARVATEPEDVAAVVPPVAPPDGGPPDDAELAARLPGEEFERRPVRRPTAQTDREREGDLFCTNCGTGNAATARFCRHCGTSLAHVTVARPPWWRRLFPKRAPLAAGERPGRRRGRGDLGGGARRRGFAVWGKVVVGLAIVAAAIAVIGPWRESLLDRPYNWARDQFVDPVEIHPPRATGQGLPGHPAGHAIDTSTATFWAPPGAPRRKAIIVRLDGATDLRKIGFRLGSDDFTRFSRPRVVSVRYANGDGKVVSRRFLRLRDTPDRQVFDLEGNGVTRVRVAIVSVYPGQDRREAAIAKIALWKRG
jgi:hypothetical protein